jgi:CheY-like chemotaxis protein/anti-sigma regulatory factor (Ser/Thr protein kinase)
MERFQDMPTVLVVDDGKVDQRLAGRLLKDQLQVSVEYADNGRQALDLIKQRMPEVVVTDMKMPVMDGLELVEAIRQKHATLPVIVMTAVGSEELAAEALQKGATSYVPKRRLAQDLARVVKRLFTLGSEHHPRIIRECVEYVETRFVLDNDCSRIAPLVRYLQDELVEMNICDDTAVMHVGVALEEALTNAIHHGNLELESALYESSLDSFAAELQERQNQPPYCDRRVKVTAVATRAEARYVIQDQGAGFDTSIIPNITKPLAADEARGRGLLLIHSVMDDVSYNDSGTQITMIKRRSK